MSADRVDFLSRLNTGRASAASDVGVARQLRAGPSTPSGVPGVLLDEFAREEWERVQATTGPVSPAQRTLLIAYCNAVACAIRAEQTLAVEGRYYATTSRKGSVLHRRHPAAHDAERGWTAARHLAKLLGITGGRPCDSHEAAARRSMFK